MNHNEVIAGLREELRVQKDKTSDYRQLVIIVSVVGLGLLIGSSVRQ